jgi:alcohol dehydrogenase class IV
MPELTWRDSAAERTVILRQGLLEAAPGALAEHGWDAYELLSTERALATAPAELRGRAERFHLVPAGPVPEASAAIVEEVGSQGLVAFGGGRVIDSAKAIAAVRGGQVAAIPTTLSGAEMTAIHRMPAGHEGAMGVRPSLVLADPEAMTSMPEDQLRATAMNALAHGADSLFTPLADELSVPAALRGARLIAGALDAGSGRDRSELALGALLSAYGLDRAGLALHHVLSQTAVRVCETPHAETNAALLPYTVESLASRDPAQGEALAEALGVEPARLRERITELGGGPRLSELGATRDCMEEVVDAAMARPELSAMTPGEVEREHLVAILQAAL